MQSIFTKHPEKWPDRRKLEGKHFRCGEGNTFICKVNLKNSSFMGPLKVMSGYLATYFEYEYRLKGGNWQVRVRMKRLNARHQTHTCGVQ